MRLPLLAALLSTCALAGPVLAQATPPSAAGAAPTQTPAAECDRLLARLEQRGDAPALRSQAEGWRNASDAGACREALARLETGSPGGEASRITVQQAAPAVRVEQASPQVTVQQAPPAVSVRQAVPEIIVRQAPPIIRVEQPQPEIIVRMPEPEVNVAATPPQVTVNVPPPNVQVVQPNRPDVQVQPAQPNVQIQAPVAGVQPNVQVERAQPNVRVERTGEPQVIFQQAEGQPTIRVERPGEQAAAPAQAVGVPPQGSPNAPVVANTAVPNPHGSGPATAQVERRSVPTDQLANLEVVNAKGDRIGTVKRLVRVQDGATQVIVGHGGFLGLGEKEIAVPAERLALHGGKLMLPDANDEALRALPAYTRQSGQSELPFDRSTQVALLAIPPAEDQGSPRAAAQAGYGAGPAGQAGMGQQAAQAQLNAGSTSATPGSEPQATGAVPGPAQAMAVNKLAELDVYTARGEKMGEVEEVLISNADEKPYMVVSHGGFLGLGVKQVIVPMEKMAVQGDRLVLREFTDEQIRALPVYKEDRQVFRVLDEDDTAPIIVTR
ncbi:MAG TPA: PRC-barrel domain-containing protein [Beijerinckiaceae bacterium]|jgi:sporulation protein YlmC with PRC-barrel domain